ncbi:MAG: YtfJ family protein [Arsenophonus sp.]|nr:YtfJ family protein [Arsenophonus sp.]
MLKKIIPIVILLTHPFSALTATLQINKPVPAVTVIDRGELLLNEKGKLIYQDWRSKELVGKTRTILHIAGRLSAKELNEPLIEAIKQKKFDQKKYQTTTIINTDDTILGTGFFVRSNIEDSKREFPFSQIIVDNKGVVKKTWQLKPKSSTIIVLNKKGNVLFAKDGALTSKRQITLLN